MGLRLPVSAFRCSFLSCQNNYFSIRYGRYSSLYHWKQNGQNAHQTLHHKKHQTVKPLDLQFTHCVCMSRSFSMSTCQLALKKNSPWKRRLFEISQKVEDKIEEYAPAIKYYMDYIMNGMRLEWSNIKEYYQIKKKLNADPNLYTTYRENMIVYTVNRNVYKVAPLMPLLIMPMGFVIIFFPIYFFPRYVLPPSFWSFQQRQRFLAQMHKERSHEYGIIVHHLNYHKLNDPDPIMRSVLEDLCTTISNGNVPTNVQMLRFKPFCRRIGGPFNGDDMVYVLLRAFCHTIMVSPYLPPSFLKHRLRTTARLVINLDRKLQAENLLNKLSPQEVVEAALMRGLDSARLSREANIYWLRNWIKLTEGCDDGDIWFMLHAMVVMSVNYSDLKYKRQVFDV